MKSGYRILENPVFINASASVVGSREHNGPCGRYFDYHCDDDKFSASTWEKAESEMQRLALEKALTKARIKAENMDFLFAGDLINQCTVSTLGLKDFGIPFFGLYGACSTAAEGLALASMLISGGNAENCAVVTSSHNCTSERQYRFPLEYGGQRTPTSQFTVTGAGAFILSDKGEGACIEKIYVGKIKDWGISDANNMGAAMAPAALDTLLGYFMESGKNPSDFDMIITGDLGCEGNGILLELGAKNGLLLKNNLYDCGLLIYDRQRQDMHAGGSGCGCFASVMASVILPKLVNGELKHILALATGALMSPLSVGQGGTIPGICHLTEISYRK